MKKFVCPVCGYVYEGDEMPADFHCPCVRSPAPSSWSRPAK